MVSIKRFNWLVVTLVCFLLTSCFDEYHIKEPKKLTKIDNEVSMTECWSKKVFSNQYLSDIKLKIVVLNDLLYFIDADGLLTVLNAKSGDVVLKKSTGYKIGGALSVTDKALYFGTMDGEVVSLDSKNGQELWKTNIYSEILSIPQVSNDYLLVHSSDDTISALENNLGKIVWKKNHTQPSVTLRGSSSPTIYKDSVLVGLHNGLLLKYQLKDGSLQWENRLSISKGASELEQMVDINSSPLLIDDTVYVVGYQGNIAAIDFDTGHTIWSKEVSSYKNISHDYRHLYLTDDKSNVIAMDLTLGNIVWQQSDLENRKLTSPFPFHEFVLVADYQGFLHLLSKNSGSMIGRYSVDQPVKINPIVSGDMVFVLDHKGYLHALKRVKKN